MYPFTRSLPLFSNGNGNGNGNGSSGISNYSGVNVDVKEVR